MSSSLISNNFSSNSIHISNTYDKIYNSSCVDYVYMPNPMINPTRCIINTIDIKLINKRKYLRIV